MTLFPRTIKTSDMRNVNASAILEFIRRESPVSRTRIAEQLGVSLPTVMRIVDALIEEDLVILDSKTEWSGGRRRPLIQFNKSGYVVIGVDLGGTKMFGAVADLGGEILAEITMGEHRTSGDESFQRITELIETLIKNDQLADRKIRGIGIGAPGTTLHQEGVVTWAPSLNWRDYPLKANLEDHFKLPVIVENDVNLAALGELWFGTRKQVENLILIAIGTGIGAGIIIDGALYRGAQEAAGEIGYLPLGRQFLGKRYSGFGAFESIASGMGIADRARQALSNKLTAEEHDTLTAEDVFQAARRGEPWAVEIIDETVDYLAMAVATISALLNPELVILGGGVSRAADLLLEPICQRIDGVIPIVPTIQASTLGYKAVVMGTIARVLHSTTDYFLVRKLI
jgi:glucokinase